MKSYLFDGVGGRFIITDGFYYYGYYIKCALIERMYTNDVVVLNLFTKDVIGKIIEDNYFESWVDDSRTISRCDINEALSNIGYDYGVDFLMHRINEIQAVA